MLSYSCGRVSSSSSSFSLNIHHLEPNSEYLKHSSGTQVDASRCGKVIQLLLPFSLRPPHQPSRKLPPLSSIPTTPSKTMETLLWASILLLPPQPDQRFVNSPQSTATSSNLNPSTQPNYFCNFAGSLPLLRSKPRRRKLPG